MIRQRRLTGVGLTVNHWIVEGVTLAQSLLFAWLEDAAMNLGYWIDATFSLLGWLFLHTVYGMLGVAILVYLLFRDRRKTLPRVPRPALVAGLVFLVGVGTLPSIPRYRFHNEMLKLVRPGERSGWVGARVASTARWRSITEPLTWVNPPIGAVTLISPKPSRFVRDGQRIGLAPFENWFHESTWRYGEEPTESLVEADCAQSTIRYRRPDESGVLRAVTAAPVKMVAGEKDLYCAHDWAREKEALRRAYLFRDLRGTYFPRWMEPGAGVEPATY